MTGEQKFGVNIVKRALEEPLRQIAANAGQEGSIVVNEVKNSKGLTASTLPLMSTPTWSKPVSSTRPKWFALRCRTLLLSPV